MRKSTKIMAACGSVLALAMGACSNGGSGGDGGSADGGSESKKIILVSKGFQHQFWQAVKQGAEEKGKELGYEIEFIGPKNEQAITEQIDQLKNALTAKPAAIGFAALDSQAAAPVLEQIKDAGIPVIAFDSGVESDIPVTTVQTDNKVAAAAAAENMARLLGGKGTVGLVCHDQTSQTGKDRCIGFQEWMKENAPDITLLTEQYAGEVGKAADAAKAIIKANPDINGIYGSNEAAAGGVVQGVKESGKTGITVVGFDSGKTQLDAIRSGEEAGAITQSPVKMGALTVEAAVKAINGESLDKLIDSGFAWYDAKNIDNDDIKANLYE